ncbi:MAG: cell division protein FtsZ [Candidatus Cloacimonadaceae bacterium]|jgi:cell division protein FtsZ|nr:cell division protein FtsZ [Candidatus Cloacimonadota bacterium]MCK9242916.1 cell division protein FtsZ [Candidatus Cloacimonadota bacterium]MDD3104038.1 cell division protein FtsZ [Candidatus Cloacimonadota bacterium]MDD3534162.1 cell division protein FtsZ [Candidatus Cloacimonadota bacterium]MDY0128399.1 cell division protein FtsZ [Candidatus Cloacimonadaceae bacterium]
MIEFDERPAQVGTNIKVIGVGGAGGNAINTMIRNELAGVEFIAANTDADDLTKSHAKMKLQLGKKLTRGLGTGANPETGSRSAEESKDEIKSHLEGADMIFLAAGMGGGTGTGATPIIAKIAREMGILTLGIVTTPFPFEGQKRAENADHGIRHLSEYVDTLIVIPNEKLCEIYGNATLMTAFNNADDVLYEAAKAVSDIITITGLINVDFADVKAVMQNMGYALMGTGVAEGDSRAINAARAAIDNPLLTDISLTGCQSLLLNITAGEDILMSEIEEVSNVIVNETGRGANIIMGVIMEESMAGKISVTLIATGLDKNEQPDKLMDFPKFSPATTIENETQTKNPNDEISNILKTLGINSQSSEEKPNNANADDPTRIKPMRTDVPSFLKALD